MNSVCVFCGSRPGHGPDFVRQARELGAVLAARGVRVIYGGGARGMMGAVADGALAGGGEVIGVIPQGLFAREGLHDGLTEARIVASMHERKATMAELADGFVALPGGIGTMEELFEVWTWAQLGVHAKPCGILNLNGYYDPLLQFMDHMLEHGFLDPQSRALIRVAESTEEILAHLATYRAAATRAWISGTQT